MLLDEIFAADGLLKQKFPQYTLREGQVKMAQFIKKAIEDNRSIVVEAPTGIGKGLAYLIPTILLGDKVIVSTSNKNLQDQLDRKDLPALQEVLGYQLSWSVLKGRGNYFCHEHFKINQDEVFKEFLKVLDEAEARLTIQKIARWAKKDLIGDLEYCPVQTGIRIRELIGCDNQVRHEKDSESDRFCFASKAKVRADQSQIILVNHTLLALDISLKKETDGKAKILPDTRVVIIDEAHEFERSAVMAFSDEISIFSLTHLLNWSIVRDHLPSRQRNRLISLLNTVLNSYLPGKGTNYYQQLKVTAFEGLGPVIKGLESLIDTIENVNALDPATEGKIREIIREAKHLQTRLKAMSQPSDDMLRWSEARDNSRGEPVVRLKSVPLDISDLLRYGLFENKIVICTSATLTVGNKFDFFRQEMGMPDDSYELIVESPFNFEEQALIYIPDGDRDRFEEIEELLKLSKGRAFILFTSYKDMNEAFRFVRCDYPKLIQGQDGMTRAQILEQFKNTPNAVLFATKSFWEGVDIQGEQLSLVIIAKVPFENPSDLVFSSKCDKIDQRFDKVGVSFIKLAVPDAAIKLKQGVGRLIRSHTDKGVIALLDTRVVFKPYGKIILDSLPPAYRTQKIEKVKAFFEKIDG